DDSVLRGLLYGTTEECFGWCQPILPRLTTPHPVARATRLRDPQACGPGPPSEINHSSMNVVARAGGGGPMFYFTDFLERLGLAPDRIRLLRHGQRGVAAWRRGQGVAFGCYASFQTLANSPYGGNVELACQFIPGPVN